MYVHASLPKAVPVGVPKAVSWGEYTFVLACIYVRTCSCMRMCLCVYIYMYVHASISKTVPVGGPKMGKNLIWIVTHENK